MKTAAAGLLIAMSMLFVSVQPSQAQTNMATSSPMMTMPKCASADPVVGVNMMTKMYMTQSQMKSKMSGMSATEQEAMMKKHDVKMMCKSQADAMGAKMMKPPM